MIQVMQRVSMYSRLVWTIVIFMGMFYLQSLNKKEADRRSYIIKQHHNEINFSRGNTEVSNADTTRNATTVD